MAMGVVVDMVELINDNLNELIARGRLLGRSNIYLHGGRSLDGS